MPINDGHEPGAAEERVLDVFKRERAEHNENRMTPVLIRERLDEDASRQNINYALSQLTAAGWVRRIADGLYEFNRDPREKSTDE